MIDRNKIPSSWEVVKHSEVAEINPKLPLKLIEEEKNKFYLTEFRKYKDVKKGFTPFTDGDVIFAKITPCMENGKCAVLRDLKNGIGFGSTEFHVSRAKECVIAKYIFYFIVQKQFRKIAESNMAGSVGQKRVPTQFFSEFEIPLPPLPEQHRIVSKIEELFSELDKGVESLKTAQRQFKVYRQAVLKWAFEGRLTHEKIKWINTILGKIISVSSGDGLTKANRNDDGEYLVYGGNGVSGKHNAYMYEDEKLIIGRVGVHCGNAHITKPKSWITDNAFVVSFDENNINIKFLYYLIWYLNLNKYSSSSAQPVISQTKIYPIEISIPEKKVEQTKVVSEIETRLSVCDKLEETIITALQQGEVLRQSILKGAFEGRLVEQDPNDEPASKLLERIKAEREKNETKNEVRKKKIPKG